MPSNFTQNYQLSQWAKPDKVQMEDFNADNAKIDAALTAQAQTLSAHAAALSGLGNCRVHITSYQGTGVNNYNEYGLVPLEDCPHIVLPGVPKVLIVIGSNYIMYHLPESGTLAHLTGGKMYGRFSVKWVGSTAIIELVNSNEAHYMNESYKYWAIAFYDAE